MYTALALACLIGSASAFVAPASRAGARSARSLSMNERSKALPFDPVPAALDGSLAGDVGFDPAGFTNNLPKPWLIGGEGRSLKWYREV
jgi:hypothetical protein